MYVSATIAASVDNVDVAEVSSFGGHIPHATDGYFATSMADVGGISALDEVIEREVLVNGIPLEPSI
ncbi:hypothetical protein Tco_1096569, partial [Tanacetum coccineum]